MNEHRKHDRPHETVAQRLKRRYGDDVDPEISLFDSTPRPAEPREPGELPAASASVSQSALERLGSRATIVSRYRIEGPIARGGMGEILKVWDQDLRRDLAMKVVRTRRVSSSTESVGEVDPRMLARFLEEAQITGQLDHPGVVPVHELGLDENGQIFFTMQLVRGRDLETIFDLVPDEAEGWTMTRAIGVLHKSCEAVAYAHAKGVIHRDLKPANVMVGHFGEVYVMDWGLARVLGREDKTDESVRTMRFDDDPDGSRDGLFTMVGDIIGTPSYMAPEQASGEVGVVDARTDVYAMGAMLYRLLTGTPPYVPVGEKRGAGEIIMELRGGPPQRVEDIAPRVSPELVAVCEKAMARDPDARYASMLEVADDLRSYLENRVVRAYETGAVAETRKWVRRNKPLALSFAATMLALFAGLVASWVLKGQADDSATAAERQARIATAVNDFLNDDLLAAAAPGERGVNVTVRDVLESAATELDGKFRDEPIVEAELRMTIGETFDRLGEYERGIPHLKRAWDLRRELLGDEAEATLTAMASHAMAVANAGRLNEGFLQLSEAVAMIRRTLGAEAPSALAAVSDLALIDSRLGRYEEASARYERVLGSQARILGENHRRTLSTRENLGIARQNQGRFEEAGALLREVVDARRRHFGERDPAYLKSVNNLAVLYTQARKLDEAETLYEEATDLIREVYGSEHPEYAIALRNLGMFYSAKGEVDDAERFTSEALEIAERTVGENHPTYFLVLNHLAYLKSTRGLHDEAIELRERLLAKQRIVFGENHPRTLQTEGNVAASLLEKGMLDEAEARLRDLCGRLAGRLGPDHPDTLVARENLANTLFRKGEVAEVESLTREVLEGRKRTFGEDSSLVARTEMNLSAVQERLGRVDESITTMESARRRFREAVGPTHPDTVRSCVFLGNALRSREDFASALATYEEAIDALRDAAVESSDLGLLLHQAAVCCFDLGDIDRAIDYLLDAVEVRRAVDGPGARTTIVSLDVLVSMLVEKKRFEEAEPFLLDLHQRRLDMLGRRDRQTRATRSRLVELYERWGKPEEAERWR